MCVECVYFCVCVCVRVCVSLLCVCVSGRGGGCGLCIRGLCPCLCGRVLWVPMEPTTHVHASMESGVTPYDRVCIYCQTVTH